MSHHVVLETLCDCAKRAGEPQIATFGDKAEAFEYALELAAKLNDGFCGRHGFEVVEVEEHFVIAVEPGGFVESCEL